MSANEQSWIECHFGTSLTVRRRDKAVTRDGLKISGHVIDITVNDASIQLTLSSARNIGKILIEYADNPPA